MAEVWKRPSLTGIEVVTRWVAWLPVVGMMGVYLGTLGMDVHLNAAGAETCFSQGQTQFTLLTHGAYMLEFHLGAFVRGTLPVLGFAVVWGVLAGVGRTLLLRRAEGGLQSRWMTTVVYALVRVVMFTALMAVWVAAFVSSWIHFVQTPQGRGEYPGYVPGFGVMLVVSLGLFLAWACVSWVLRLAPVMAMGRGLGLLDATRAAWRAGPLRGKLIEINLVMGIVKVAILVVAMAFSASPLPFQTVETQGYIDVWWCGVGLLWVLASDYFHVVRQVSYVRLAQAYDFLPRG